jgi:hypothetical protein
VILQEKMSLFEKFIIFSSTPVQLISFSPARGNQTENVVPDPSFDLTSILPP